jgi:hypothetical protein
LILDVPFPKRIPAQPRTIIESTTADKFVKNLFILPPQSILTKAKRGAEFDCVNLSHAPFVVKGILAVWIAVEPFLAYDLTGV